MAISLSAPRATELKPRIVVFGVGGAGGNAVNNMIEAGLEGVEFVVANTDAQQLQFSRTDHRVQLGASITRGLGAGAHPEVGMSAAQESEAEIAEHLEDAHMVFITAGMGGGTGTGAAPVIARCARERGILTVGVVTKPFTFEGRHRMRLADAGILELQRYVDTLIVIPNQNLFRVANERTTFAEAFGMADQVLHSGVRSITDLMVLPGLINLDFADVRTVMSEMGKAMMGTGEASGDDRALMAAQNAIQNPLLDETSLKGAKAVLVNVTGGPDMTLMEVDDAANAISNEVDPEANIIFGAAFDPLLVGKIRVSVVATGMDSAAMQSVEPRAQLAAAAVARRPEAPAPQHAAASVSAPSTPAPAPERGREPVVASGPELQTPRFAPRPAPAFQSAARAEVQAPGQPQRPAATFGNRAPEPETVRSFDPERTTLTGARKVDIREPRVEEVRLSSATPGAPIARIVDPLVEDEDDYEQGVLSLDGPVSTTYDSRPVTLTQAQAQMNSRAVATRAEASETYAPRSATRLEPLPRLDQPEERKTGWRGLFGGRSSAPAAAPQPAARVQTQLRAMQQTAPELHEDAHTAPQDDLEIPSFLRRLAN